MNEGRKAMKKKVTVENRGGEWAVVLIEEGERKQTKGTYPTKAVASIYAKVWRRVLKRRK